MKHKQEQEFAGVYQKSVTSSWRALKHFLHIRSKTDDFYRTSFTLDNNKCVRQFKKMLSMLSLQQLIHLSDEYVALSIMTEFFLFADASRPKSPDLSEDLLRIYETFDCPDTMIHWPECTVPAYLSLIYARSPKWKNDYFFNSHLESQNQSDIPPDVISKSAYVHFFPKVCEMCVQTPIFSNGCPSLDLNFQKEILKTVYSGRISPTSSYNSKDIWDGVVQFYDMPGSLCSDMMELYHSKLYFDVIIYCDGAYMPSFMNSPNSHVWSNSQCSTKLEQSAIIKSPPTRPPTATQFNYKNFSQSVIGNSVDLTNSAPGPNAIYCHSCLLGARSHYFRKFFKGLRPCTFPRPEPMTLNVDGSILVAHLMPAFLSVLYTDILDLFMFLCENCVSRICAIHSKHALKVLEVKHLRQVSMDFTLCEKCLDNTFQLHFMGLFSEFPMLVEAVENFLTWSITPFNLLPILHWSKLPHGSNYVHTQVCRFLKEHFLLIYQNAMLFHQIPKSYLITCLKSNRLQASENEVLYAVLSWVKHQHRSLLNNVCKDNQLGKNFSWLEQLHFTEVSIINRDFTVVDDMNHEGVTKHQRWLRRFFIKDFVSPVVHSTHAASVDNDDINLVPAVVSKRQTKRLRHVVSACHSKPVRCHSSGMDKPVKTDSFLHVKEIEQCRRLLRELLQYVRWEHVLPQSDGLLKMLMDCKLLDNVSCSCMMQRMECGRNWYSNCIPKYWCHLTYDALTGREIENSDYRRPRFYMKFAEIVKSVMEQKRQRLMQSSHAAFLSTECSRSIVPPAVVEDNIKSKRANDYESDSRSRDVFTRSISCESGATSKRLRCRRRNSCGNAFMRTCYLTSNVDVPRFMEQSVFSPCPESVLQQLHSLLSRSAIRSSTTSSITLHAMTTFSITTGALLSQRALVDIKTSHPTAQTASVRSHLMNNFHDIVSQLLMSRVLDIPNIDMCVILRGILIYLLRRIGLSDAFLRILYPFALYSYHMLLHHCIPLHLDGGGSDVGAACCCCSIYGDAVNTSNSRGPDKSDQHYCNICRVVPPGISMTSNSIYLSSGTAQEFHN